MLARGDVLGVTQGESPAMRRLFRAIQPTGVHDCVFATAMVRPVAMSGRQKAAVFQDWSQETMQDSIVFEDDAIEIISSIIGVDAYEADSYRRAFAKSMMRKFGVCGKNGKQSRRNEAMAALQDFPASDYAGLTLLTWEDLFGHSHTKKHTTQKHFGEPISNTAKAATEAGCTKQKHTEETS